MTQSGAPAVPRLRVYLPEHGRAWLADFEDQPDLVALYGRAVVPLPYLAAVPGELVAATLQLALPECQVVWDGPAGTR